MQAKSKVVCFDISAQRAGGGWDRFQTVTNRTARDAIDRTPVYRLLKPLCSFYSEMGVYHRDLEGYKQRPVPLIFA